MAINVQVTTRNIRTMGDPWNDADDDDDDDDVSMWSSYQLYYLSIID
jgi:hypothetical protein